MGEIKEIQNNYNCYRNQLAKKDLALQQAKAELDNLKTREKLEIKALNAQAREKEKEFYNQKKNELNDRILKLSSDKNSLVEQLGKLSKGFLKQFDPLEKIKELDDSYPILMFPLRLETRFKSTENLQQLWLRVYPDDCNINRKEDFLSESELKNLKSFWVEIWKAGGIESEERGAWRSLVNSHGSGRSGWMIKHYGPLNVAPTKGDDPKRKILVVISSLELSDAEQEPVRNYWAFIWLSKGNKRLLDQALEELKESLEAIPEAENRINEILEKYVPVNILDKVPVDIENQQVQLEKLELPSPDEYTTTQTSWTQAPKAFALPDKFTAILYTGNNRRIVPFENPVKENLHVGPDPSLTAEEQIQKDKNGDLILNEDLKWMVDFDKAIEVGMGVKIDLETKEANDGLDKLFVVGLRFTSDVTDNKIQLEKLITDHFQSKDGFGLLKQGTPTNNTEEEPSAYSWTDNADESFERIFKHIQKEKEAEVLEGAEEFDLPVNSDGRKLADSLRIDPAIFTNVPNASGSDQLEANAINTALFPATLGYFMEEMMHPLFSAGDIDATKAFFSNFVSGRGPIPAIRIGKQPYGILPISVYSKLKFYEKKSFAFHSALGSSKTPYLTRLHNLLMKMDTCWNKLLPQVAYIGKDGDQHQVLLDVIGLHANSVEFHQRYAESIQQLYNQLVLQESPIFAALKTETNANKGKNILKALGIDLKDLKLPILEKYFLSEPNLLSGPLVDDVPLSEINKIRPYYVIEAEKISKHYIEWLTDSDAETIRIQNFNGNPAPNALLYLLLRHALMLAQADSASQLLVNKKVVAGKNAFYDPDFIHVQTDEGGKSKFEHLYNTYPTITGSNNLKLVDYLYQQNVLHEFAETKRLRETLDALRVLEETPTARLERLLIEHLDCCNYRIDAWKTGLVNYKLTEQRIINQQEKKNEGLHLGAYGWLIGVKRDDKVLTDVYLTDELKKIFSYGNNTPIKTDSNNLGYIHAPSLNQAATAAILRNAYDSYKEYESGNPFAINLTSDRVRIAGSFLEGMRNGQSLSALLGYQFERGLHDKISLGQGEVDKFIYPLRKAFPLVADNLIDTESDKSDSIETIQANNVMDGLKFIQHIQTSPVKTYPFGLPDLPTAGDMEAGAINSETTRLIDIHDAISDLVISEQVYQVEQGNFDRASGVAKAFSNGGYPPEFDVMNTPRSGVVLTHRMAIQFNADAKPEDSICKDDEGNTIINMTPRSKAEPSINEWLASILPDPKNVQCIVEYSSPSVTRTEIKVTQADLGLQAIDLLYVFNLDTEQAMTELDDRIFRYCRYDISKKPGFEYFIHPNTIININYTSGIDNNNRTKVSFFELAALIKSLRKILIGAKFINSTELTLQADGQTLSLLDDVQLSTRITSLINNDLIPIKTGIENIQAGIVSISQLSQNLKSLLEAAISDASQVEALLSQFKTDLKDYSSEPTITNKTNLLDAFENAIQTIGDAEKINNLKAYYQAKLLAYEADLTNFDPMVENTINTMLALAQIDNTQTGTGFMQQGISGLYESVFNKLDKVIKRWDQKVLDYTGIIAGYDGDGNPDVQFELLRKAERIINTQPTFSLPMDFRVYKTSIDDTFSLFNILLNQLKLLKSNAKQRITEFIIDREALIKDIGKYDVIAFDSDNNRNNLKTEKLGLVSLKEDIIVALENVRTFIEGKISSVNTLISESDATVINSDKIAALQKAAKTIFGEEAIILPCFKLDEPQATEFENSYNTSERLLDFVKNAEKRIFPVEDWLGGVSRVREKVYHWENICILSNAFKSNSTLELSPLQFPYQEEDRWLAMKFRDDKVKNDQGEPIDKFQVSNDKLLFTAHFAVPFAKVNSQCGIVIDEWTEVIPSDKETTGIAFHYDQPNSEPPQTMLLVVPPEITGTWKWEHLIESMEETLELAKKRAIEPSQIETTNYAQFLPTTMMAVTYHWITVATNLALNNNIYQSIENN